MTDHDFAETVERVLTTNWSFADDMARELAKELWDALVPVRPSDQTADIVASLFARRLRHGALKGATPLGSEGMEPIEGLADEPPLESRLADVGDQFMGQLEEQLKNMTAKWMERGEEIDRLVFEFGDVLRAISHKEATASGMPYRDRASLFREVGEIAREALRRLA